ncbi:DUF6545 domain-containing protein [Streptomyces sp. NPDC056549]|uniref:DUF6545 domain-containing protein n=1 Tax=Streptomyces sp. NPDC056549 TaxID=3345864 RepID=UPI00367448D9
MTTLSLPHSRTGVLVSERVITAICLCIAAINLLIACWKAAALRRERTPTLALTTLGFFVSVLVYVAASPTVYDAIGKGTGRPSTATLPMYAGIIVCYGASHLSSLFWDSPGSSRHHARTRRRVSAWAGVYLAMITGMATSFLSADLSTCLTDPIRFNTNCVEGRPSIFAFLTFFLSALSFATLNTARLAGRSKPQSNQLRHALRWFQFSMVIAFGYVLCSAPAVVLVSFGSHHLDEVGLLGVAFGALGAFITSYGMSGAAISAWLSDRRDIKSLHPLWNLVVVGVDSKLTFGPSGLVLGRLAHVRFTLHRRVIEILDGMRVLRSWSSPVVAEIVSKHVRAGAEKLSPELREALLTAAVLREAAERLGEAQRQAVLAGCARPRSPDAHCASLPGEGTAASAERARLLLVARHLEHPLVVSSLKDVQAVTAQRGSRTEVGRDDY